MFDEWLRSAVMESPRLLTGVLLLLLTWSIGQAVLGKADLRKKRREIDLALSLEFELRFGEFKALWRQWKAHYEAEWEGKPSKQVDSHEPVRWQLFADASAAEGKLEAIFVKLATERRLSSDDLRSIGLFRQAYQELREAIRDCEHMPYKSDHPRYAFFNTYGCRVAHILVRDRGSYDPSEKEAVNSLITIHSYRKPSWKQAVDDFARERGLAYPPPRRSASNRKPRSTFSKRSACAFAGLVVLVGFLADRRRNRRLTLV